VGGGFAGVRLASALRARSDELEVALADPRPAAVFLPLLPDVVAGKVRLENLLFPLERFCRRFGIRYFPARAAALEGKTLVLEDGARVPFDFLAMACGGTPDFHGNAAAGRYAFPLYSASDASALVSRLEKVIASGLPHTFVVAGGGYTGVEAASALAWRIACSGGAKGLKVRIVEPGPAILGGLPPATAEPVRREVARLGIEVAVSARIGEIGEGLIEVDGEKISDCTVIWSAGVRPVDFIQGLPWAKDRSGRLLVNADLSLPGESGIFALGDCAAFAAPGGGFLRAAVQFSWAQGPAAALNILHRIRGLPVVPYRPRDYGYLVPVASGKAWGEAMGRRVGGRAGSFLHYFMCVLRTLSCRRRLGLLRDLISGLI